MSRREKKMRTKRKSIKKDEDKEEKEKPSAGLCALIYSTPLSYTANVIPLSYTANVMAV